MYQYQLAKKEIDSDSVKASQTASSDVTIPKVTPSEPSAAYGSVNSQMVKTLPPQKSSAQATFFNNFVVESTDRNGRTSLRQIIATDR